MMVDELPISVYMNLRSNSLPFVGVIEYRKGCLLALALASVSVAALAQPSELPILTIQDLRYAGAFRVPADEYGASNMNYAQGPIEYNGANHSLIMVGHSHHQAVAEFAIPPLVQSTVLGDLNMAGAPLQNFVTLLDRTPTGNPQTINRIGGLELITVGARTRLMVNGYEYYDAPGDNTHTSLVADDPSALQTTAVAGFLVFEGGAGHTSGWISPIPSAWQSRLGGSHLTGQSSGIPIISRTSVGPSAFAFEAGSIPTDGTTPDIATIKLLDFSLDQPLHGDLSNTSRDNDIWTHLSRVVYGVIVPGTRTYLTVGHSGGHSSGVCYKCRQDDGHLCGGYCSPQAADNYQYYWLWDVNDLADVKDGRLAAHDVQPYEYGELETPFATEHLGGGTFDPDTGLLYLTVDRADREQGTYSNPPVVVAYTFATGLPDALFANGFE